LAEFQVAEDVPAAVVGVLALEQIPRFGDEFVEHGEEILAGDVGEGVPVDGHGFGDGLGHRRAFRSCWSLRQNSTEFRTVFPPTPPAAAATAPGAICGMGMGS